MCKKTLKAYMTVEASVVFPIVFGGIIFTIFLGIYLYNVSVIKQIAYIAALRGSQLTAASSSEIENFVKEQLESLVDSKVIMKRDIEEEIKVSVGMVKVKLRMNLIVPWKESIFSEKGLWKIEKEALVSRYNPVDFIRKVRIGDESQISK